MQAEYLNQSITICSKKKLNSPAPLGPLSNTFLDNVGLLIPFVVVVLDFVPPLHGGVLKHDLCGPPDTIRPQNLHLCTFL